MTQETYDKANNVLLAINTALAEVNILEAHLKSDKVVDALNDDTDVDRSKMKLHFDLRFAINHALELLNASEYILQKAGLKIYDNE